MKKLSCKEVECIELFVSEHEDIELILYVEESEITYYKINEDGSLNSIDSDYEGQKIWLRCPCCDTRYEFDQDYFEIEKCRKLGFDVKDKDNFKINRVKESWEI